MNIEIFYDEVNYRLRDSRRILKLIEKVIREHKKDPVNLSFIFTDNKHMTEINREFLKHNYNTDVIAFNYDQQDRINGEIYMSVETIKKNANNYKVSLREEILRVMIHGTLHLCGYNDGTKEEKSDMRSFEDYWLSELRRK